LLFAPVGRKKEPARGRQKTDNKIAIMSTVTERKKKAGRPPKAVKKEVRASVRFTRPEYFIVTEKAAQAGITPAGYLRQIAIHGQVTVRLTDEDRQDIRTFVGIANNINQIAKCCHQEGALKAMALFRSYKPIFDTFLKKMRA